MKFNSLSIDKTIYFVIACILAFLLFFLAQKDSNYKKHYDPYEYAQVGKNIWNGKGIVYNDIPDVVLPPGFPMVIGAVDQVFNNSELSGKFIGILSFFLSLLLIQRIGSVFGEDKHFTQMVLVLFSTNSNILSNAASGYSEALFTLIFLALVWTTLRSFSVKLKLRPILVFGVLWSWLYLIRPEGIVIGALLFLWVLRNHIRSTIIFITPALFVILIFPYLFFLKENTGVWQLSGKTYINLVMGELNGPYQNKNLSQKIPERYTIIDLTHSNPTLSYGFIKYWAEPENDLFDRIPVNLMKLSVIYWLTFSIAGLIFGIWGLITIKKNKLFLLSILSLLFLYLCFFVLPRTVAVYHWVWIFAVVYGIRNFGILVESKFHWINQNKIAWFFTLVISVYQFRSVLKILLQT